MTDAARGRGIGRALVAAAEAAMEASGARQTEVATQLENDPARGLYESLGYEASAPERAHHFWLQPGG